MTKPFSTRDEISFEDVDFSVIKSDYVICFWSAVADTSDFQGNQMGYIIKRDGQYKSMVVLKYFNNGVIEKQGIRNIWIDNSVEENTALEFGRYIFEIEKELYTVDRVFLEVMGSSESLADMLNETNVFNMTKFSKH